MRSANRAPARRRRGVVSVAMIVLLIIVDLIVVGMVMGGVRDLELTVRAMDTLQAFYASEGGMNMAVREWIVEADEDGDGARALFPTTATKPRIRTSAAALSLWRRTAAARRRSRASAAPARPSARSTQSQSSAGIARSGRRSRVWQLRARRRDPGSPAAGARRAGRRG